MVFGAIAMGVGALLLLAPRIPWLGRLPGDIMIRRGPVTVYVPLVTCLAVSIILSILLGWFGRR